MRISRLVSPGLLTFLLALVASGVLVQHLPPGLPATPLPTLLLVPAARLCMFCSGSLALGGAILGGLLDAGPRVVRMASRSALLYAAASAIVAVATLADVLATAWWQALDPQMLRSFLTQIDEGRYLVAQIVLGVAGARLLRRGRQPFEGVLAVLALGVAVVLPAFTGHSAAALPHWIASATMVVHLFAISAWIGGVAALVLAPAIPTIVGFGRVAGIALPAVLASGVLSVIARVNDWAMLLHDRYAAVLALKIAVTAAVMWFAVATRQRVGTGASTDDGGVDVATAARRTLNLEASLMFVVLGLAVVLARMPNP